MIDLEKLKKDRKLIVRGHGTYLLLPRKKGEVKNSLPSAGGKVEAVYKDRIVFKPSVTLKRKVCL